MLNLLRDYRGILTNERLFEKGQYSEIGLGDELVSLLLEKGYATRSGVNEAAPQESPEDEDGLSLSELRTRYKELAGKGASPKWDAETLAAKIAELESSNA